MPIILDLDNTLLNTSKVKMGLSKALIKYGVSEELFRKVYKKLRQKSFYNHKIYLDFLSKEKEINQQKCKAELIKSDQKIKSYLYPDALWFLKKMRERGAELILLSWGDKEFQKIKISQTKIAQYFDKIIITETSKLPHLAKMLKQYKKEQIYFINDDTDEIKQVAEKLKNIKIMHIKRKEKDKEVHNINLLQLPAFSNLKQVEKYLQ